MPCTYFLRYCVQSNEVLSSWRDGGVHNLATHTDTDNKKKQRKKEKRLMCPTYPVKQQWENLPATPTVSTCHTVLGSLSFSVALSSFFTHLNTHTHMHNGCSKFFQGISRLINRLVVWGSSEVQRSRLNPLTRRIISGRWVHTSPIFLPSPLDLW